METNNIFSNIKKKRLLGVIDNLWNYSQKIKNLQENILEVENQIIFCETSIQKGIDNEENLQQKKIKLGEEYIRLKDNLKYKQNILKENISIYPLFKSYLYSEKGELDNILDKENLNKIKDIVNFTK